MKDLVFNVRIGAELRRHRGDQKQIVVARKAGITQASLSFYENGKRGIPLEIASRLAQELDFSLDDLLARAAS